MNKKLIVGVGGLVVAAVGAWLFWPEAIDPYAGVAVPKPSRLEIPETIVLLADPSQDRHLLLVGSLELMQVPGIDPMVAERRERELRDALITWLSGRRTEDLEGLAARLRFKRDIRSLAESILFPGGEGWVVAVRFRRLLIQAG